MRLIEMIFWYATLVEKKSPIDWVNAKLPSQYCPKLAELRQPQTLYKGMNIYI